MNRGDKKEMEVLRAVNQYKGCWVSARFATNNLPVGKNTKISSSIAVGQVLSRIGFAKRFNNTTAPNSFFIDDKVIDARLKKIVERKIEK